MWCIVHVFYNVFAVLKHFLQLYAVYRRETRVVPDIRCKHSYPTGFACEYVICTDIGLKVVVEALYVADHVVPEHVDNGVRHDVDYFEPRRVVLRLFELLVGHNGVAEHDVQVFVHTGVLIAPLHDFHHWYDVPNGTVDVHVPGDIPRRKHARNTGGRAQVFHQVVVAAHCPVFPLALVVDPNVQVFPCEIEFVRVKVGCDEGRQCVLVQGAFEKKGMDGVEEGSQEGPLFDHSLFAHCAV